MILRTTHKNFIQISFGQALLILIKQFNQNKPIYEKLKKLYLSGIKEESDQVWLQGLIHHNPSFANLHVLSDVDIINEDASRRYFETHLAYETLKVTLAKINLHDLQEYYNFCLSQFSETEQQKFEKYLQGVTHPTKGAAIEYLDAINKIKSHPIYQPFLEDDKQKLILLMQCSWITVSLVKLPTKNQELPLNIYELGYFSVKARGRIKKKQEELPHHILQHLPTLSDHFGLIKNYMALPKYNDISSKGAFNYTRCADQYYFDKEAPWIKEHFSGLVDPFSGSISGTLLCWLRVLLYFYNHQPSTLDLYTPEKLINILRCIISSLLFNSGGHGINEFVAVLKIQEVEGELNYIMFNMLQNDGEMLFCNETDIIDYKINAETLFFNDNETAFEKALSKAIFYNEKILNKKLVLQELVNKNIDDDTVKTNKILANNIDYTTVKENRINYIIKLFHQLDSSIMDLSNLVNNTCKQCEKNYNTEKYTLTKEMETILSKFRVYYKNVEQLKQSIVSFKNCITILTDNQKPPFHLHVILSIDPDLKNKLTFTTNIKDELTFITLEDACIYLQNQFNYIQQELSETKHSLMSARDTYSDLIDFRSDNGTSNDKLYELPINFYRQKKISLSVSHQERKQTVINLIEDQIKLLDTQEKNDVIQMAKILLKSLIDQIIYEENRAVQLISKTEAQLKLKSPTFQCIIENFLKSKSNNRIRAKNLSIVKSIELITKFLEKLKNDFGEQQIYSLKKPKPSYNLSTPITIMNFKKK